MILGIDRLISRANGGFVSARHELGAMTLQVSNGLTSGPNSLSESGARPNSPADLATAKQTDVNAGERPGTRSRRN